MTHLNRIVPALLSMGIDAKPKVDEPRGRPLTDREAEIANKKFQDKISYIVMLRVRRRVRKADRIRKASGRDPVDKKQVSDWIVEEMERINEQIANGELRLSVNLSQGEVDREADQPEEEPAENDAS